MMLDYKNTIKKLKSCTFTCIDPQLASEAALTIQLLAEQLDMAEQCICAIEDHLNRGTDNDWAREEIVTYENFAANVNIKR